ncbi:hypothetical protein RJT34_03973 [Clitoria ternatea]|uniref:Uncharacterized protein n=1 Tax=Clitoria ternatea TaxID=43366 RepID=A0AAN9KNX5_CLITE
MKEQIEFISKLTDKNTSAYIVARTLTVAKHKVATKVSTLKLKRKQREANNDNNVITKQKESNLQPSPNSNLMPDEKLICHVCYLESPNSLVERHKNHGYFNHLIVPNGKPLVYFEEDVVPVHQLVYLSGDNKGTHSDYPELLLHRVKKRKGAPSNIGMNIEDIPRHRSSHGKEINNESHEEAYDNTETGQPAAKTRDFDLNEILDSGKCE